MKLTMMSGNLKRIFSQTNLNIPKKIMQQSSPPLPLSTPPDTLNIPSDPVFLTSIVFLVPLIVFVSDHLSKSWVKSNLDQYEPVNIIGHYLRFTYCENPGMAFGIQLGSFVHILTFISALFTFYIIYYLGERPVRLTIYLK